MLVHSSVIRICMYSQQHARLSENNSDKSWSVQLDVGNFSALTWMTKTSQLCVAGQSYFVAALNKTNSIKESKAGKQKLDNCVLHFTSFTETTTICLFETKKVSQCATLKGKYLRTIMHIMSRKITSLKSLVLVKVNSICISNC